MEVWTPICNILRGYGMNAEQRGTAALLGCAACAAELEQTGAEWCAMDVIQKWAEEAGCTQGAAWQAIRNALRRAGVPMTPAQAIEVLALGALVAAPVRGYCRLHCCPVEEVGQRERLQCEEARCRDCDWYDKE